MFTVRNAAEQDIPQIIAIHRQALPGDLLAQLGEWYLDKVYHIALTLCACRFLVAAENNVVAGVIIVDKGGLLASSLVRGGAMVALAKSALMRPHSWLALLGALFVRKRYAECKDYPEIFLLAVSPAYQNLKLGVKLVDAGHSAFAAEPMRTKTSSQAAKAFYERIGFQLVGDEYRLARHFWVLQRPPVA
jgi:ribosomal protein S18 acetylase RimI-like enzyme